jgi:hypothetical protein
MPRLFNRKRTRAFFVPHKHMVRPVQEYRGDPPLRGTVEDNLAGVCFGSSGRPFGLVVYVRVGDDLHAVLMPAFVHPDSVEAYRGFLNNDRETLRISSAVFDTDKAHWEVSPTPVTAVWPKKDASFEVD